MVFDILLREFYPILDPTGIGDWQEVMDYPKLGLTPKSRQPLSMWILGMANS